MFCYLAEEYKKLLNDKVYGDLSIVTDEEKRKMHLQQGRIEGREEGILVGREEGIITGREEERLRAQNEKADFIRNLKESGVPIDKIVMASGLTRPEVEAL